jgi:colicin import membrane protein
VRRVARVDMNSASAVMREWRRAQTTQATPVTVQVPEAVQQSSGQALATLWVQAQELANESLRAAQTVWETERTELDGMRQELAIAYESQAGELEAAQALAVEVGLLVQEAARSAAAELAGVRADLVAATTRAERAEAKVGEIAHQASDLRTELDRAHQEADQVRTELARQGSATQAASAERDQARKEAGAAKEEAATLRGQAQALQGQAAELMRVLAVRQESVTPKIA